MITTKEDDLLKRDWVACDNGYGMIEIGPAYESDLASMPVYPIIAFGLKCHKKRLELMAKAPRLLRALKGLSRECTMIHKHWGPSGNQKQADAAIAEALKLVSELGGNIDDD